MSMTYDPSKVIMTYGPIPLFDFGEGTFITCEADQDDYRAERGADGAVDFIRNIGRTFTVTAQVLQTSKVNDLLSAMRVSDFTANTGTWPLLIKTLQGVDLQVFPQARIIAPPTVTYGSTTANREWRFKCINGDMFVGGNIL